MKEPNAINKLKKKLQHELEALTGDAPKNRLYAAEKEFKSEADAAREFSEAKERLFEINRWSEISALSSTFTLHDAAGNTVSGRQPQKGDLVKIELPATKTENWVEIKEIRVDRNSAQFTVRPSPDPHTPEPKTKHFFSADASSTFRVEAEGNKLRAFEIGLNEYINNQGPEAGDRGALNTLIAEGGWAFFQKIQWQSLTDYLVGKSDN